jgi:two-component system sensor histidine kinase DesK
MNTRAQQDGEPVAADQQATGRHFFQRPEATLIYLPFVFFPLIFDPRDNTREVLLSVLACLVYLPVHYAAYGPRQPRWTPWASAAIGYALMLVNFGGNTFIIYAMAHLAQREAPRVAIVGSLALLGVMTVEVLWVYPSALAALSVVALVAVIGTSVVASALYERMQRERLEQLRLSHDEVRRLGATAERERIARDLHDLLGHTLSVVVLKSELAGKLLARDPAAARVQIGEVEAVARQALAEVREAVTGMRGGDLEGELAAGRLVLLGAGIELAQELPSVPMPPGHEATLAICLREAITNVLRHARARRVEVTLAGDKAGVELTVQDDGRGGARLGRGHGLSGISERLEALGGSLAVEQPTEGGTRLRLMLPLPAASAAGVAPVVQGAAG